MSQHTFTILCNEVRQFIEKQTTRFRESISVEKRVAVTIWKLATKCEYRTISNLFGIGISAVSTIIIETCQAIAEKLLKKYVFIPRGEGLQEIVRGLKMSGGFPKQLEQLLVLMFRSSSLVKVHQLTRILLYYSPRTS